MKQREKKKEEGHEKTIISVLVTPLREEAE